MIALVGFRAEAQQRTQSEPQLVAEGGLRGAPAVVTLLTDLANGADFATAFHQRMAMPYDDFQQLITQQ